MIFCARATRGLRRMGRIAWSSSCSRNAHDRNVLARANGTSRRANGWAGEKVSRIRGSTRLPLEVKSGIETTRAVEDHSVLIPNRVLKNSVDAEHMVGISRTVLKPK
jgi:hypothetical protein